MGFIWELLVQVFWLVVSIAWWLFTKLLWLVIWFLLPFAIVAFVAFRLAGAMLGREVVWLWLKKHLQRYSTHLWAGAWVRTRRISLALAFLPLRVLAYLALYGLWHSIVSLVWTPKWSPWRRAWGKRWRPATRTRASSRQLSSGRHSKGG